MIRSRQDDLDSLVSHLTALSPQGVLDRGYAVVLTDAGTLVTDSSQVSAGSKVAIRVAKGTIAATVNGAAAGE